MEMNMGTGSGILRDLLKALGIGTAAAFAAAVVLFVIGYAAGGFHVPAGVETVRNGSFAAAALGMFLLAGMLMVKGKKQETGWEEKGWCRHFAVIGVKTVLAVLCAAFLLMGTAADYLQLNL